MSIGTKKRIKFYVEIPRIGHFYHIDRKGETLFRLLDLEKNGDCLVYNMDEKRRETYNSSRLRYTKENQYLFQLEDTRKFY